MCHKWQQALPAAAAAAVSSAAAAASTEGITRSKTKEDTKQEAAAMTSQQDSGFFEISIKSLLKSWSGSELLFPDIFLMFVTVLLTT